jgi:hypothetical protein
LMMKTTRTSLTRMTTSKKRMTINHGFPPCCRTKVKPVQGPT